MRKNKSNNNKRHVYHKQECILRSYRAKEHRNCAFNLDVLKICRMIKDGKRSILIIRSSSKKTSGTFYGPEQEYGL